jgi:UPF0042 nucleotide-binding protein
MAQRQVKRSKPGARRDARPDPPELLIISGLSGSGKATVLKTLEDNGYYSVDHLPLELLPKFAELTKGSPSVRGAALVIDIREGESLRRFPAMYEKLRRRFRTHLLFLDAKDETLVRRYSETRRPHPLAAESVLRSVRREREQLEPIRALADDVILTDQMNVHELRKRIVDTFCAPSAGPALRVSVLSFGYRHGVPPESDLVFDVRFLPNPNYIPEFKPYSGKNRVVARYIRGFPQTREFLERTGSLLEFLLPHYVAEGKTYLTISVGCTGGRHRSVMMAEEIGSRLADLGYNVRISHRDINKG